MASQQLFLLCDNTNATNFKSWAKPISDWIRTCGWTNSSDTGQLNGQGAGPGGWATLATVPGSGAFYYEIFQPGDGLQNFYLKMEYGNGSGGTNSPTLKITIGTSTNGAGTLTGFTTTARPLVGTSFTAPSTTVTYECNMSGDSGKLAFMLWRNAPNQAPQLGAIQRSLNASGSPTSTYVTVWTVGHQPSDPGPSGFQQSLVFGVGPGTAISNNNGWTCINLPFNTGIAFNGTIPLSSVFPEVGYFDYPCTVVTTACTADLTEGVPFSVTNQYGQTKTYMPSKVDPLCYPNVVNASTSTWAVCMEYD